MHIYHWATKDMMQLMCMQMFSTCTESSCLLSGPGLQLDSRYIGSRGSFGGSSGMPSAGEEDSVAGTLKHVKSSVARSGGIVLWWSSGYGGGG